MLLSLLAAAFASPVLMDVAPGCRCASLTQEPAAALLSLVAVGVVVFARRTR